MGSYKNIDEHLTPSWRQGDAGKFSTWSWKKYGSLVIWKERNGRFPGGGNSRYNSAASPQCIWRNCSLERSKRRAGRQGGMMVGRSWKAFPSSLKGLDYDISRYSHWMEALVRLVSTTCHRTSLSFPLSVTHLFAGPSILVHYHHP